jgi:phage-related tail fiber protein
MATIDRRGATVSAADPSIGTNPNPDLAWKAPVRVATTTNINLQTFGLGTIDGVALAAGDRVLVKNQTDQTTNGLYNASTGPWTRTVDAANNSQWTQGLLVTVTQGVANAFTLWILTAANPIVLGTTLLPWRLKI